MTEATAKPFGNKYTNLPGQMLDMWHMKGVRTGPWGLVHDQYTDLGARYGFSFAAFDNAQVRHATSDDAMFLVFGKK